MDDPYIKRANQVTRKGGSNDGKQKKPWTIAAKLLDFKEKEEFIRRSYTLKDTYCYFYFIFFERRIFKETVEIISF